MYSINDLILFDGIEYHEVFATMDMVNEIDYADLPDDNYAYDEISLFEISVASIYNINANLFLEIGFILIIMACIGKSAQFGFHI